MNFLVLTLLDEHGTGDVVIQATVMASSSKKIKKNLDNNNVTAVWSKIVDPFILYLMYLKTSTSIVVAFVGSTTTDSG